MWKSKKGREEEVLKTKKQIGDRRMVGSAWLSKYRKVYKKGTQGMMLKGKKEEKEW